MDTALDLASLILTIVVTIAIAAVTVVLLDRDGFLARRRDRRRDRVDLTRVDEDGPT